MIEDKFVDGAPGKAMTKLSHTYKTGDYFIT